MPSSLHQPPPPLEASVTDLYRKRFPAEALARRQAVWQVLCRSWLDRYVDPEDRVLEVAAGYCEFINNIQAAEKTAIDLNPEMADHAAPGVRCHRINADELTRVLPRNHFDVAFMSNFLEHCRSRDQILAVLREVCAVLRPGGRLLILGPNFRCCYREYYDYFDHHLALTENAVAEALDLAGYDVELVQPQTLPFSFRGRLPSWPWLVKLYLHLPFMWRFFGAQFFLVGRKPATLGFRERGTIPSRKAS